MNRQELEKMFDENFIGTKNFKLDLEVVNINTHKISTYREKLKDFIFNTVIPEVLKSVIPELKGNMNYLEDNYEAGYNHSIDDTEIATRKLYGIEL